MNLQLPNFGKEKPGYSYYFYPIFLYFLGIVDMGMGSLMSYLYDERDGNKGVTIHVS